MENEAHKKRVKNKYDKYIHSRFFFEGDRVLVYDKDKDPLGACKFKSMWLGPYIITRVLEKGTYALYYYEGKKLVDPRNEIYLKY